MKKIVILGGGFAGLRLARKLSNKKGFDVTLIDRLNYHQFQPLLYQVATAGLDASDICFPFRRILQKSKNVHVRLGNVQFVDFENQRVVCPNFEIGYDILVVSTGTVSNFFGNKTIESSSFGLKSGYDAMKLRNHLLKNFEKALVTKDEKERQKLLTIVVAGAGATGVEISGAIADMRRYVLYKDFPELDLMQMKIYLIDGVAMPLRNMSPESSAKSLQYLQKLGVEIIMEQIIHSYDGDNVVLANGTVIPAATLIWSAGVTADHPQGFKENAITKGNRLLVNEYNQVEGYENVFAIGDVAFMTTEGFPNGHPQLASVANGQADNLAKNFFTFQKTGKFKTKFHYKNKGTMATVGRNLAVFDSPKSKIHLKGTLAWFIFMMVHLFLILGVKNQFFIFVNWVYNYITYDQSLRFIFEDEAKIRSQAEQNTPTKDE